MTEGTCFPFSFSWAFSLPRAAVGVFCVRGGGNDTFHGGPTTAGTGGSMSLRNSPLCPEKEMKSQFLKQSQALNFSFFFLNGVCGEERLCNSVFLTQLQHVAEGG